MDRRLALAFAVGALAGCAPAATKSAGYSPPQAGSVEQAMCLLGFTAVPLRQLMTGHHLVEARLNNRTGTFVLDTGANATVLDAAAAGQFGLSGEGGRGGAAIGLGGAMNARQVKIESLAIGGVPLRSSRIVTADLGQLTKLLGPMSGGAIHGIVGQDVMKEHRAVIDVARPILYLIPDDREPAPVPAERCRDAAVRNEAGGSER